MSKSTVGAAAPAAVASSAGCTELGAASSLPSVQCRLAKWCQWPRAPALSPPLSHGASILSLSVVVRSGRGRFVLCWCFEAAAAAPWSRPVWSDAKQREVNAAVAGSLCAFLFFFAQRAVWPWTPSLRQPPQNAENSV